VGPELEKSRKEGSSPPYHQATGAVRPCVTIAPRRANFSGANDDSCLCRRGR
jgi:hypothetical protein